jgi:crotonobetainyl-CoA:carnitine CoA-transferase CaiB-like acyl-CoA transferase
MAETRIMPLAGCRVLELGSTVAGPFCGRLLADFGAEVIKVEPLEGDAVRSMGGHFEGRSLYAASIFRNKYTVSLDLKNPRGQEAIRRIIPNVDVVIENFRPGTLERWGLGYDDLKAINPGLIMVRISGFGQNGPYRERPGYGFLGDAASGFLAINGYPDLPPVRSAVPVTDMVTALYGAYGVMLSLRVREQSGEGQYIDAALYESAFSLMESHVTAYDKLRVSPGRAGPRLPGSTPNSLYPAQNGGYVAIAAASDSVFRRLAPAIGRPELCDDERFSTARARNAHHEEIDAIIGKWTAEREVQEIERHLHAAQVPVSKVFTMADIFEDPHYQARNMVENVPDEQLGTIAMPAPVPKLSQTPGEIHWAGHAVGADNLKVLSELAGFTPDEIEELVAAGAVGPLDAAQERNVDVRNPGIKSATKENKR